MFGFRCFVVCCLLFVAWCLFCCRSLCVACCLLFVVRRVLFVVR